MSQNSKVRIKVQPLSGFDKSFYHDLTANVGTLVPALCDEVPAGIVNLNVAASVQLPPVASDTFMKTDLKLEAFFCPTRLVYGGWEKFYSQLDVEMMSQGGAAVIERAAIPCVELGSDWEEFPEQAFGAGSLFDYLGGRINSAYNSRKGTKFNMLSALCYHKVYDEWYRNVLVQQQLFSDGYIISETPAIGVANMPFLILDDNNYSFSYTRTPDTWLEFLNGDNLFTLHQRNYGFDYFTNAWPTPQLGSAMSVATDQNGNFTISALRVANSFQQFSERMLLSPRYYQAVKARTGFEPSAMDVQRPVFLGSASIPITTYGVDVNAVNYSDATDANRNPFALQAGAQIGRAVGRGAVNLIDNFKCTEPGFIIVLASVAPRAVYSSGFSRMLTRYNSGPDSIVEHANAQLANVGNQPIYSYELNGFMPSSTPGAQFVFGYTDRYADWKTKHDQVSGRLREGQTLSSFALKRNFPGANGINISDNFLKIPITALDEVSATDINISTYGAWMQFGFDYKVAMALPLDSMPSLQDPAYEHGHDVELYRGGFRF